MADAQDRNLPASEKKIRKARREGQVARSRDLGHLLVVGLGAPWPAAVAAATLAVACTRSPGGRPTRGARRRCCARWAPRRTRR
jgi:hypothetical protein